MTSPPTQTHQTTKRVGLLTFPDAELLDAVGPLEVFAKANDMADQRLYEIDVVAPQAGPVVMGSGIALVAGAGLDDNLGPIDTLLIGGGDGTRRRAHDARVQAWVERYQGHATRVGSVCTGSYVLAAGGYLDGVRATTHWRRCDEFAVMFPRVRLEPDAIYVRDGRYATSAGITAGIDLALALVEEDHGRELTFAIARQLVVFAQRAGGQSQFSAPLLAMAEGGSRLDEIRHWVIKNLPQPMSVETLAARAGMAPRSFARRFRQETGMTPGAFIQVARIDAARRALEIGRDPIKTIAHQTGFGHEETMRRAFIKHLKVSPHDYRQRWSAPHATSPTRRPPS